MVAGAGLAGLSLGQVMYIGGMSGAGVSLFGDLGDIIFKGDDISTGQALLNMVVSGALGATLAGAGYQLGKLWGGLKERLFKPAEGASKTGLKAPKKAYDVADEVLRNNGSAPQGYKGGRTYANDGRDGAQVLPKGNYKEYDVNPYVKGQNRGAERIVIGDDGSVWYTNDHYNTFAQLK